MNKSSWEKNEEIAIFREYLQIPSVHPNVNYDPCIAFLKRQAQSLGLPIAVHSNFNVARKPVVIITWEGRSPSEKSILLNSHMDVVPVFEEKWTYPPFSAHIDEQGRIFARGTQDMKCVGTWYLGAIRALLKEGKRLKRTVHVVYVPDEETGSDDGWMKFVHTPEFRALNGGFALDEGCADTEDRFPYFFAERINRTVRFRCHGSTGHGSYFHADANGPKVRYIINKLMDFQESERLRLKDNQNLDIGEVTTVNLTILDGGTQQNVLPTTVTLVFDIRVAMDVNIKEFENRLTRWSKEAGNNVEIEFLENKPKIEGTSIDDTNPYWIAFHSTLVDKLKYNIKPFICPARTDANIIRGAGIPAIGFSPMRKTPRLLHDNNEYIRVDTYLEGLTVYKHLINSLGNV